MNCVVEIRGDIASEWLRQNGWFQISRKTAAFPKAAARYSHKRYPERAPFHLQDAVAAEIFHQFSTKQLFQNEAGPEK